MHFQSLSSSEYMYVHYLDMHCAFIGVLEVKFGLPYSTYNGRHSQS